MSKIIKVATPDRLNEELYGGGGLVSRILRNVLPTDLRLEFNASGNSSNNLEINLTANPDGYTDSLTRFPELNFTGIITGTVNIPSAGTYYLRVGYNGNKADDKWVKPVELECGEYIITTYISTNKVNRIVCDYFLLSKK